MVPVQPLLTAAARFDPRRAIGRSFIALAVALASGAALSFRFNPTVAALGGWDAGGAALLVLAWTIIARCDDEETQQRASSEDPGRTSVYVVATLTSFVSLFAAVLLQRHARFLVDPYERSLLVALCLLTVGLSCGP